MNVNVNVLVNVYERASSAMRLGSAIRCTMDPMSAQLMLASVLARKARGTEPVAQARYAAGPASLSIWMLVVDILDTAQGSLCCFKAFVIAGTS